MSDKELGFVSWEVSNTDPIDDLQRCIDALKQDTGYHRPIYVFSYHEFREVIAHEWINIDVEMNEIHIICPDGTIQSLG